MTANQLMRAVDSRRRALGLTIMELCVEAGHSSTWLYWRWMCGEKYPNLSTLLDFCEVLGLAVNITDKEERA